MITKIKVTWSFSGMSINTGKELSILINTRRKFCEGLESGQRDRNHATIMHDSLTKFISLISNTISKKNFLLNIKNLKQREK